MLAGENVFQLADGGEGLAAGEAALGFDRLAAFLVAPHAQGVEVFKREADRVHAITWQEAQRGFSRWRAELRAGWVSWSLMSCSAASRAGTLAG